MPSDFGTGIQIMALVVFQTPVQTFLSTVVGGPFYLSPNCPGLQPGPCWQRALCRLVGGDQVAMMYGDHVLACYGTREGEDAVCRSTDNTALLRRQINPSMTAQPRTVRRVEGTYNPWGGLMGG